MFFFRARDTKGRINALIEDLGLAQVRHTRVRDLTVSEKQRLNVACHLLLGKYSRGLTKF